MNFVMKTHNEMYNNNALVNSDRESRKDYFFSLVKKNKELSENEKVYCKERFIYNFESKIKLAVCNSADHNNCCKSEERDLKIIMEIVACAGTQIAI